MFRSLHLLAVLLVAVAVSCMIVPTVSAQGMKLGYVKEDRIQQEYKAWQRAQDDWNLESKAWEDEALAKQQELQDIEEEYEKQKLILSDDKKREREAAINAKKEALDAYTRQVFGPNGTAERKNQELLRPILENIQTAIEAVAIEGNYDLILTLQSVAYIKETYDVTDEVLTRLEELE
ncbi:MAG: OmpH family outer membrane protein [candidate division Zixibacteria bacterium]|nr:OmpH family outer membrane protein [candidate division Zixibacteria bacterium]MDH3937305.1 OmpH family outer membrane protein [candidate division Zixibacteria bacterium]MDH4034551.1 OmpH family outer membrane protein [candidate division Zixibacteria bacterium]